MTTNNRHFIRIKAYHTTELQRLFFSYSMATARGKAELSDIAADHAREDYEIAKLTAKQFAPDFIQPGVLQTFLYIIL